MMDTETALLENAMDALDRLFDSKSEIVDTYLLTYATAQALRESRMFVLFDNASTQLQEILRSGLPKEEARERALDVTNELRIAIADLLPGP
ncbi:hypothetical protein HNQ60_005368 [Povalibacter uvarum]|uniref:Uncharacterized protein n=1 Tax=Povalibacter uvarum TaxID=732238 RepID=A0A841HU58_9GAMM|nr:hypothetical protein [Povalibacter uvarum]